MIKTNIIVKSAPILIFIFLAVTFIQYGYDKVKNDRHLFCSNGDGGV
jgi:Na+/H+-dicarboxylate symporter